MGEIIKHLDEFIRQNAFISMLIGGVLCNFTYEVLKKSSLFLLKISAKKVALNHKKSIEKLIKIYSDELEYVKSLHNNSNEAILDLIDSLYKNILYSIYLLVIFFIINKTDNIIFFYSFLGSSITLIFGILKSLIYNYKIILKAKDFTNYSNIINRKIEKLISLKEKQTFN